MSYNYYKILGISEKSGVPEIKRAYRDLAKKYHPDHTKGSGEYFIVLNEAYQVLSDPIRRRSHDEYLGISAPFTFNFNEAPSIRKRNRPERRPRNEEQYRNFYESPRTWDPPVWVKYSLYLAGFLFGISVTSFSLFFVATAKWPLFMLWVSMLGVIILLDSFSGIFFGNTLLSSRLAGKIKSWFL